MTTAVLEHDIDEGKSSKSPEIVPAVSIIVPAYNEEGAIAETVASLTKSLAGSSYEIIVVNDGSRDGTQQVLESLQQKYDRLRVVTHPRNRGYGAALKTGMRQAASDLIAITDADGTYPNERLPELVGRCADFDMVVGARTAKDVTYSKLRAFPKYFLRRWVSWLAGRPVPDINSGMRVFRKDVAREFIGILPDGFSFTITITLSMMTTYRRVEYVPISYYARVGKSKIRPIHDTLRFMQIILRTGTYFAPLRAFMPMFMFLFLSATGSLFYDVFWLHDLTEATLLLFLFSMNIGMFMLLADMIDKRGVR